MEIIGGEIIIPHVDQNKQYLKILQDLLSLPSINIGLFKDGATYLYSGIDKEKVIIIFPGYPERIGVWAFSTMYSQKSYFEYFDNIDHGLVVINPHFHEADFTGRNYLIQLKELLNIIQTDSIGIIGYSMGGKMAIDVINSISGIFPLGYVLLDPIISDFVDNKTDGIIISIDQKSIQSTYIIDCKHSDLPERALHYVIDYFNK